MEIGIKTTFWKLMNDTSYKMIKIPNIQRDYVQGRTTEQVEHTRKTLLLDIAEALRNNQKTIDLNFIYGKVDSECFIPIDGQQRLTTLFLIHTFAFAKEKQYSDNLKILQEKFTYETRITTKRFLEKLTKNLPAYFEEKQYDNIEEFILDADWFSNTWLVDPSVKSCLVVLKEIEEIFGDIEDFSLKLISDDCPIVFMSLFIENMGKENDLYIKMNSRGKALTDFEAFKSEFFKYIDNNDASKWPKFKQKIDNEWTNMIWNSIEEPYTYSDTLFLNLIRAIIYNRAIPNKDNYDEKLIDNINKNIFFIYDNYEVFLKDTIDDIYKTFQFLEYMQNNYKEKYDEITSRLFDKLKIHDDLEIKDRVILFAITKYAVTIENWDIDSFSSWYRIINNLINNTPIDAENRFIDACKSINSMSNKLLMDSNTYFAQELDSKDIKFFADLQVKEEIYKCKLIKKDARWKERIVEAENHDYFEGQIAFALKLIGADIDNYNTIEHLKLEEFNDTWNLITRFYNEIYNQNKDNLFKRALLIFGNYAIWANSSKTFFFEGGNRYFDFRDLLRENKSFNIFQKFFEYIKEALKQKQNITEILEELIENYDDKTDTFRYYLIKVPELFESMKENRYKEIEENNKKKIILYKKYKLNAGYAEFYSFVLKNLLKDRASYKFGYGYLDNPDSIAYIDKIDGKDCYIEYDEKFRDKEGNVLRTSNGSEVVTVDDALEYVRENFN